MHTGTYHQGRQGHSMLPVESLAFSLCSSFLAVLKKGGTETASAEPAVHKVWGVCGKARASDRAPRPAPRCCVALARSLLSLVAISGQTVISSGLGPDILDLRLVCQEGTCELELVCFSGCDQSPFAGGQEPGPEGQLPRARRQVRPLRQGEHRLAALPE